MHCVVAGAVGGSLSDTLMHGLDTLKNRQQGYTQGTTALNTRRYLWQVVRQEGGLRGLYSGYSAALLGSIPTCGIFFGCYEYLKRWLVAHDVCQDTTSHLVAGLVADGACSVIYVPTEVVKTRLQLQESVYNPLGRHVQYRYRHLQDAFKTIYRQEGLGALYLGYRATLLRDMPFSALQFAFYEQLRLWALECGAESSTGSAATTLPVAAEMATGAVAGGLAGLLTTPLDVIKTRLQTQGQRPAASTRATVWALYRREGGLALWRGVVPRVVWCGLQSSVMLLLYQELLVAINGKVKLPRTQPQEHKPQQ